MVVPATAFPLNYKQKRLQYLLNNKLLEEHDFYFSLRYIVGPHMDMERLKESVSTLAREQVVLRTVVAQKDGSWGQSILPITETPIDCTKIFLYGEDKSQQIWDLTHEPFSNSVPPFRVIVLEYQDKQESEMILVSHHMLMDTEELRRIGYQLCSLYHERMDLYNDFKHSRVEFKYDVSRISEYMTELQEKTQDLELPTDYARPAYQSMITENYTFTASPELVSILERYKNEWNSSYSTIWTAIYILFLSKLSRSNVITLGLTDLDAKSSHLLNYLLPDDLSFSELVQYVEASRTDEIGAIPLNYLLEHFPTDTDFSRHPLFQAQIQYETQVRESGEWRSIRLYNSRSMLDLALKVKEINNGFEINLQYNSELFQASTIERYAGHLLNLAKCAIKSCDIPWKRLSLLSSSELYEMITDWNSEPPVYSGCMTLADLFEQQVERYQNQLALEYEGGHLTYQELNERANKLAHLLQEQGANENTLIAICLERSPELIISVLAILKAGSAYVPLDAGYPDERLKFMLQDAQPTILITQDSCLKKLPDIKCEVINWDRNKETPHNEIPLNPVRRTSGENLACIIFTSGSTGKPKAGMLPHKGLINIIQYSINRFELNPNSRIFQFSSVSFDAFILELFMALLSGGSLQLTTLETFEEDLARREVCTIVITPAILAVLEPTRYPSLKNIVAAGEALPAEVVKRWEGISRFFNIYGPSEVSIYTTIAECKADGMIPTIGRPIPGAKVYILDEQLQPVPIGVPGELFIGGIGVGKGYLNRTELTGERFISNPFIEGDTLYRTGDLVRYRADRQIHFLGRLDHQVKIRGLRIELGEIEAVISAHPLIKETVVVSRSDKPTEKHLVAYFTSQDSQVDENEIRRFIGKRLPQYMVPSYFVLLEKMPLNPNHKVDRNKLPAPNKDLDRKSDESNRVAEIRYENEGKATVLTKNHNKGQLTNTEIKVLKIIREVLENYRIQAEDNFFEYGGHSLKAVRVITRIDKELGYSLSLAQFFLQPSAVGIAQFLGGQTESLHLQDIVPAQRDGSPIPLSFSQEQMWLSQQIDEYCAAFNCPFVIRIQGALDLTALQQSIQEVINRHEILRTNFVFHDNLVQQQIHNHVKLQMPLTDLTSLPTLDMRRQEAKLLAQKEASTPFKLDDGPLFRFHVATLSEDEYWLLFTIHHIVFDGWSLNIFDTEWKQIYNSIIYNKSAQLRGLQAQYLDYTMWQQERLEKVRHTQLNYWKDQLLHLPSCLPLPTDRPRASERTFNGSRHTFSVNKEITKKVRLMANKEGTTTFVALFSVYSALLARLSGQMDIPVGIPVANRIHPDIEALIGYFVNTVVMRIRLKQGVGYRELLRKAAQVAYEAQQNQDFPIEKLVQELQIERDPSYTPLFQVMFVMQNAELSEAAEGLQVSLVDCGTSSSMFDLTFVLTERVDDFLGSVDFNTDLFDSTTIEMMVRCYLTLLSGLLDEPEKDWQSIPIVDEASPIYLFSNPFQEVLHSETTVIDMLEEQVRKNPDLLAVVHGSNTITYRCMNNRINRVANYLQKRGIGTEQIVGICMERSIDMIVSVFAILKAGAAYLPLDSDYPMERIAAMVNDARPRVILTQRHLLTQIPQIDATIICLDDPDTNFHNESEINPIPSVKPHNLAYVIYTSGSTGKPKGVEVEHGGFTNVIRHSIQEFSLGPEHRVLQFSSIGFDAAAQEIMMTLSSGATLCLSSIDTLAEDLVTQCVTVAILPPSVLSLLEPSDFPHLQIVESVGEACTSSLVNRWAKHVSFFNGYGPTETTIWTTGAKCEPGVLQPPIGKPIPGASVYVLNECRQLQPVGVHGELYIGGLGVCRGYLGLPEMTAQRFILDPFTNARMYRTGDIARWRKDGQLEFLGRVDDQVKIRGLRIELGEIEASLMAYSGVKNCVVTVYEEPCHEKYLVAYAVLHDYATLTQEELRESLKNRLPRYMIPNCIMIVPELPLTTNGKVNKQALPKPELMATTNEKMVAPRNDVERQLAHIWCDVLKLREIGVFDDFFLAGGHSLLANQVVVRIRAIFKVEMSLRTFMQNPTISELARVIKLSSTCQQMSIKPVNSEGRGRLSFAQERLWFLNQLSPDSHAYHIPFSIRFHGRVNPKAIEKALNVVISRHESLRTVFIEHDVPNQIVKQHLEIKLEVVDLTSLSMHEQEEQVKIHTQIDATIPFHLEEGPLIRAKLLVLSNEEHIHILHLTVHHIVFDGWSCGNLFKELGSYYKQYSLGKPICINPLPIQYLDYANWQRNRMETIMKDQFPYWMEKLYDAPVFLDLPADFKRPYKQEATGERISFGCDQILTQKLSAISREEGTTLFVTLLTGFNMLLSRLSGQEDLIVGVPVANRSQLETENLIGFFVDSLVIRTCWNDTNTVRDLLHIVRESVLGAFEHQDVPFERLVEELHPIRELNRNPLFQVMFNMVNVPGITLDFGDGITASLEDHVDAVSKVDMTLYAVESEGTVQFNLVYNPELFSKDRIHLWSEMYLKILQQLPEAMDQYVGSIQSFVEGVNPALPDPREVLHVTMEKTVVSRFHEMAMKQPENLALVDPYIKWTYEELDKKSNQLAHCLLSKGIGKGNLVAISAYRCAALVWALIGTMKAGASFLILDQAYPINRHRKSLETVSPDGFILLETDKMDNCHGWDVLVSDSRVMVTIDGTSLSSKCEFNQYPDTFPYIPEYPDDMAYIAFTSGTTGTPKGVMGTHLPLTHFITWHVGTFHLTSTDHFSMLSGLSHDPLLRDIFAPLTIGASLWIPDEEDLLDGEKLRQWMRKAQITCMHLTPAMGQIISSGASENELASVHNIFFGGDKLVPNDVSRIKKLSDHVKCVNFYGTTETPQAMAYQVLEDDLLKSYERIPVGRGIDGVQLLVLDKQKRLVNVGEVGEVYIRTPYLTKGYTNDLDLTKERYIINPYTNLESDLLYRTYDLGRYLADGSVELLGRVDRQLKIRGFRIEPAEVEQVLFSMPQVSQTAVSIDMNGQTLIACIVQSPGMALTESDYRKELIQALPYYMIPASIAIVDVIPLTPNGKVDWKRIAEQVVKDSVPQQEDPLTEDEAIVARIWEEVLGRAFFGRDDNFFECGGHSLLIKRVLVRIREVFAIDISIRDFFEHPTLGGLTKVVQQHSLSEEEELEILLRMMEGNEENYLNLLEDMEEEEQKKE